MPSSKPKRDQGILDQVIFNRCKGRIRVDMLETWKAHIATHPGQTAMLAAGTGATIVLTYEAWMLYKWLTGIDLLDPLTEGAGKIVNWWESTLTPPGGYGKVDEPAKKGKRHRR